MSRFKVKKSRDRRFLSETSLRNILGKHSIVDRRFQLQYTRSLIFLVCGVVAVANLAILIFAYDYFQTVSGILLQHLPNLLEHLEREFFIIAGIGVLTPVLLAALLFFYGMRFTGRFIAPVVILKEHMKSLSRGNWGQPGVRIRQDDEFQELVEAYNYFFQMLRQTNERESDLLTAALASRDTSLLKESIRNYIDEKQARWEQAKPNPESRI